MGIGLKDASLLLGDDVPQPWLPPGGAVAPRNGRTTGLQTPLEVDAGLAELHRGGADRRLCERKPAARMQQIAPIVGQRAERP
jgi:hypothetical protein